MTRKLIPYAGQEQRRAPSALPPTIKDKDRGGLLLINLLLVEALMVSRKIAMLSADRDRLRALLAEVQAGSRNDRQRPGPNSR